MMITKHIKVTPIKDSSGKEVYAKEVTTFGANTTVRFGSSDEKEYAYFLLEVLHGRKNGSITANNGRVRVEIMITTATQY